MQHLPDLISDLGLILVAAAIVSLLCKKLKQPLVLGYLVAGFLIKPALSIAPNLVGTSSLQTWADIGVIFLLFSLGLEFSFKKLAQVGMSVSITAVFEVLFMLALGFVSGTALGWNKMDSLFLGGILSISSTTIIAKTLDELGLRTRKFVNLVLGALVIEDIVAVLLLVLLSTVAVSRSFSGGELFLSALKLVVFVVLWFVLGIYFLPSFLQRMRRFLNEETILIVSIGLCLTMVIVATKMGFSAPLGAFVMGSLLAETRDGRHIEKVLRPVKNLFAAVFFVSVGLLIEPHTLVQYSGLIFVLSIVTVLGKILSTTLGALISGQTLKVSIQSGMSLAQIGEFSYIIATLGLTLKVTSEILYPVAVGVSILTTFFTPFLIQGSDRFYRICERTLPENFKKKIEKYQQVVSGSHFKNSKSFWGKYGIRVLINAALVLGVLYSAEIYSHQIHAQYPNDALALKVLVLAVLTVTAPFLWALGFHKPRDWEVKSERPLVNLFQVLRWVFVFVFIGVTVQALLNDEPRNLTFFVGAYVFSLLLIRYSKPVYLKMEKVFKSNLEDKQKSSHPHAPQLAPWDASLVEFVLSPDSRFVARMLSECEFKEKYGVTVAIIERGRKKIVAPSKDEYLFPYDKLFMIGTDEELLEVQSQIEYKKSDDDFDDFELYGLESFTLSPHSFYSGKSIRECGLREHVNGLIVGVEREGKRILNPDSSLVLDPNDLIWIVGDKEKIQSLKMAGG